MLAACAALVLLRIGLELEGPPVLLRAEVCLGSAWLLAAALAGALVSRAPGRLAIALPVIAAIAAVAWYSPYYAVLGLTHLHNVVGVAVWVLVFRRRPLAVAVPLVLVAVGAAAAFSGALAPLARWSGGLTAFGLELGHAARWLAPGFAAETALSITLAYVFLQAIHYSVWLGWIPQEDVRAEGTLTFRMSGRSLLRDFGAWGTAAIAVAAAVVLALATVDLLRTRDVYLSIAAFHGYLELAVLAYLFTARTRAAAGGSEPDRSGALAASRR